MTLFHYPEFKLKQARLKDPQAETEKEKTCGKQNHSCTSTSFFQSCVCFFIIFHLGFSQGRSAWASPASLFLAILKNSPGCVNNFVGNNSNLCLPVEKNVKKCIRSVCWELRKNVCCTGVFKLQICYGMFLDCGSHRCLFVIGQNHDSSFAYWNKRN